MVFLQEQVFKGVLNWNIGKLFQESIFQDFVRKVRPVIYLLTIPTFNQLTEDKINLDNLHILGSIERHCCFKQQIKPLLKQKISMNRIFILILLCFCHLQLYKRSNILSKKCIFLLMAIKHLYICLNVSKMLG